KLSTWRIRAGGSSRSFEERDSASSPLEQTECRNVRRIDALNRKPFLRNDMRFDGEPGTIRIALPELHAGENSCGDSATRIRRERRVRFDRSPHRRLVAGPSFEGYHRADIPRGSRARRGP